MDIFLDTLNSLNNYDHCYETGDYDDQYCYDCPYKEECSGYTESE